MRIDTTPLDRPLAGLLATRPTEGVRLAWLGQAGFILDTPALRLVIDPYLSDSLAEKYAGTARPHRRMMPPPIAPEALTGVDLVLSTHAHTDHMDPGTLKPLLAENPDAHFVAPQAMAEQARLRSGLSDDARLILVDAGDVITPLPGLSVRVTRAAHETLETDAAGRHRFLGYALTLCGVTIWQSGDGIPFDGQVEEALALRADLALLPVNGRRRELSENGVPGNFHLAEAVALSRSAGIGAMVAHHYGLFDFNTADPATIDATAETTGDLRILRARTDRILTIRP